MQSINTLSANDPVSQAVLRSQSSAGRFPVPLVSTFYDIRIVGGLAAIVARRTFRNNEQSSIEATLTFPLPVHAVLYSLEARIGGRTLKAVAKQKSVAREDYEQAIDAGKTAVLHEELIKGVHMLSIGHVAPGTDIEVTARFGLALSWQEGRALLNIPTTVGDIFGASALPDSDDLAHGGTTFAADLTLVCNAGTASLIGGSLENGRARIPLDRPITIEVRDWQACDVAGRSADGRDLTLSIQPAPDAESALDAAILVDRSGSMGEPCSIGSGLSKHAAVLLGLREAAADLAESDRLNLWEFDTTVTDLGTARAGSWRALIRRLGGPQGGTEIGAALGAILAQRPVRDIVVITDGKSHALDVQGLAASGARFSVVLIGEDSLEANIGHLAALTGGEIFAPAGADVTAAVRSAFRALRALRAPIGETVTGSSEALKVRRSGMTITVAFGTDRTTGAEDQALADDEALRAAGAYAASVRVTRLPEAEAGMLAAAEGLVTHLTSLILVDEEGTKQSGLPATRKVALPSPATQAPARYRASLSVHGAVAHSVGRSKAVRCALPERSAPMRSYCDMPDEQDVRRNAARTSVPPAARPRPAMAEEAERRKLSTGGSAPVVAAPQSEREALLRSLSQLPDSIDWRREGQRLADGNVIGLAPEVADIIDAAATVGLVKRAAKRLGLAPRMLVIGLLARAASGRDRFADRVYRAVLAKARTRDIAHVAERLGLSVTPHAAA